MRRNNYYAKKMPLFTLFLGLHDACIKIPLAPACQRICQGIELPMHKNLIDLHTHSTASDGTDSPKELMAKAKALGLSAIALTDHDTLGGLAEAESAARDLDLNFIRGCEISTRSQAGSHHIIGLWVSPKPDALEAWLEDMRRRRNERNAEMLERLRALGIEIHLEDVEALASGSVGRPHMAAALVARGYAQNEKEAFREYLDENGKAYVPKRAPAPEEALQVLKAAGATTILAHPCLKAASAEKVEALTSRLVACGLDALEAWHSSHSYAHTRLCVELAERYGIGLSGGTDYHGNHKQGISLGTGYGGLRIPLSVLEALQKRRQAQGLPC